MTVRAAPVLALAALALAGCGGEPAAPRAHAVEIRDFAFVPADLEVAPGDTVVWTNRDVVPHTATAADGAWDSGEIAANASWRLVVPDGGAAAEYRCAYHPTMTGALAAGD